MRFVAELWTRLNGYQLNVIRFTCSQSRIQTNLKAIIRPFIQLNVARHTGFLVFLFVLPHKSLGPILPRMSGKRFGWGESAGGKRMVGITNSFAQSACLPYLGGSADDSDKTIPRLWTPVIPWYDCGCSCTRCLSISLKRNHTSKNRTADEDAERPNSFVSYLQLSCRLVWTTGSVMVGTKSPFCMLADIAYSWWRR